MPGVDGMSEVIDGGEVFGKQARRVNGGQAG
jgi:hypothetical protein